MSHSKRSRIGLLPRWQRLSAHLIFTVCAVSGLGFLLKRQAGLDLGEVSAHSLLVWHGTSSALTLVVLGSVLPGHVRGAWYARRNRATGVLMLAVMVALMATGLLLYYGSEEARDTTVLVHWAVGLAAVAAFPLHLVVGRQYLAKLALTR